MFKRLFLFSLVIFLMLSSCTGKEEKQQPVVFKQVPEIQDIKPEKPVKIKLRRNAKGEYSWDINGDSTDEIIKTDKKLKEGLSRIDSIPKQ